MAWRFGIVMREPARSRAEWKERARRAEADGFDLLMLPDHLGMQSPLVPLVSAAEATDRLRVCPQVLNNEFYNPVLLAREVAAVDLLTDGRLEIGLGAGHAEAEFRATGIPYQPARVRVERLSETVPVLRALLAGERVEHEGRHQHLVDAELGVPTAQDHIPFMIGGNGDRVLALAARHADTVGLVGFSSGTGQRHTKLSHFTWAGLAERIAHLRRYAGDRFERLELSVLVQQVADGPSRVAVASELAEQRGMDREMVIDSPFLVLGSMPERIEHIERLAELGVGQLTVFEPYAPALVPLIEHLR